MREIPDPERPTGGEGTPQPGLAVALLLVSGVVLGSCAQVAPEEDYRRTAAALQEASGRADWASPTEKALDAEAIEALFAEAPRRIVEISRLMALPSALPQLLEQGPGETAEGPMTAAQLRLAASGPAGEGRWAALSGVLEAALGRARRDARLEVLILGAAPSALIDRAAKAPEVSGVTVSDPDPRHARSLEVGDPERNGVAHVALDEIPEDARFDLVLAGDALH